MANSHQAIKRARQAEDRRQRNASGRSEMRTFQKKVIKAIESGDKAQAQAAYTKAMSLLDRAARSGLIHTNKAARHKSRLSAKIKAMSA